MIGFIIAVPRKYEEICYKNVIKIRNEYKIDYPIEIWQVYKNEISNEMMDNLSKIKNLTFKYVSDYMIGNNFLFWKGFQVKGFILKYTKLKTIILCDADIEFYRNPLVILEDDNYKKTGTYFFRDLSSWKFSNLQKASLKFNSIDFFNERKRFIRSVLPIKPESVPKECSYIYDENIPSEPVNEAYQESGCVYINREMHKDTIDCIYFLNENYNFVYNYIWGDKETFWLGCLIVKKGYHINDTYGYNDDTTGFLTHKYNNEIFFAQIKK